MDNKLIETINEKTPIVDLVSEFVSLSKRGKNYMGLCPFHQEKTPSFSVSPEKNIAKCMGCGEGGSPINFYRKIKNISFEEACEILAERAGIEIKTTKIQKDPYENFYKLMNEVASFYQFNLKSSVKGQEAMRYLYNRQMTDELILHFKIGYAPPYGDALYQLLKDKGYAVSDMIKLGVVKQSDEGSYYDLFSDRIIFPITNPKGDVVGLSGRTTNPKEVTKYINSPETVIFKKGLLLYHFNEALSEIRKAKQVVLYEGFFDVISSYAAGVKNGVATMGTALTKDQAKLIKSVAPSVIIAYDGDAAGLKAADHGIPILEKEQLKVEVLSIPDKMDPDEFIKAYGPEKYELLFGEYTRDGYAFRYQYYKQGKDFNNANDLQEFKKQVLSMIRSSDSSIKAYYVQRLSTDFNIPIEQLDTKKALPTVIQPNIKMPERQKMTNKFERAERYLIFAMIRSREVMVKSIKSLKKTDFADHLTALIRIRIEHYYEDHLEFEMNDFLDELTSDQRDYMESIILKDLFWRDGVEIKADEIDHYIELIKQANSKRRLNYLKEKISGAQTDEEALYYAAERDELIRQLMH